MTLYRLYLRSRVCRELLAPGEIDVVPDPFMQAWAGRQERPTMVCDDRRYSYVISGREEFEADNDAAALSIARVIYDAAGDVCDTFELWDGTRQVDQTRIVPLRATALAAGRQNEVVRTEEALLHSRWAIARSRRLLARLEELRDSATAESATRY